MALSKETGALTLESGELAPGRTRARIDGRSWLVIARFVGARPAQVTLVCDDPAFGEGWDDYSEKKERARRAVHDAWLERALGPAHRADDAHACKEWRFAWGRVISAHDPRGGATDVQIIYE